MLYKIKEVDAGKCNGCEKCAQVCHACCFDMISTDDKIVAKFQNADKCDACGDCIIVCPIEGSAIALIPLVKEKSGFVKEINPKKCSACEKCISLCPDKNIEITEENGKVFAKIKDPKKCVADGHCTFCCDFDTKTYSKS